MEQKQIFAPLAPKPLKFKPEGVGNGSSEGIDSLLAKIDDAVNASKAEERRRMEEEEERERARARARKREEERCRC